MNGMIQELTIGRARVVHLSLERLNGPENDSILRRALAKTPGVLTSEIDSGHALVIYDPVVLCHHDVVNAIEGLEGSSGVYRAVVVYVMPLSAALRMPYTHSGVEAHA